jgi:hypothetical protein
MDGVVMTGIVNWESEIVGDIQFPILDSRFPSIE